MIITVTQLNNFVKGILDSEPILSNISLQGEIINYKETHDSLYFSLKDNFSQVNCYGYIKNVGKGYNNGIEVIAEGYVSYLPKYGRLSFTATKITMVDKLGNEYKKLLELKEKLSKEGCFDDSRKRKVPNDCKSIGVVTSPNGAVIHDIDQVIRRRNPSVDIYLYPVKVQGIGADDEIVEGIDFFSKYGGVDAIILARGGGNNEDLSSFNSAKVVYAINRCTLPIISAIGHDIDYTFADFASDRRAITPTEAGELLTVDAMKYRRLAMSTLSRMYNLVNSRLQNTNLKTTANVRKMSYLVSEQISCVTNEVNRMVYLLDANNPTKQFQKGFLYATIDEQPLNTITQVKVNDEIKLTLRDGKIKAKVTEVKE